MHNWSVLTLITHHYSVSAAFPPRWVAKAIDGSFTTVRLAITTAILVGLAFAVQVLVFVSHPAPTLPPPFSHPHPHLHYTTENSVRPKHPSLHRNLMEFFSPPPILLHPSHHPRRRRPRHPSPPHPHLLVAPRPHLPHRF